MHTFSFKQIRTLLIAVIAVALLAGPMSVQAQDVANGSATATLLAALTVTATNALAFGNVYQGISKTVANNVAQAGVFTIAGAADAQISIYMQLPEYLQGGVGNDRMVVSFSTTDATVDSTANVDPTTPGAGGWDNINPHAFPTATRIGGGGSAAIFLGGQVFPSVNQTAGAYSADIVLTVSYTGS
ncbi:MAG: hypothetical protein AB1644_08215 [Candidatus Zixiibacteriota bacterium]